MNIKKITSVALMAMVTVALYPTSVSAEVSKKALKDFNDNKKYKVIERPLLPDKKKKLYRDDEIIVKYKNSDKPVKIKNNKGKKVFDLVKEHKKRGDVEYAEPNYIAYADSVPDDTWYSYQWNFDNDEYGGVHAEAAWDITDGSGVVVAVVDSGVAYEDYGSYYQAPDLEGTNFVTGYDFVNNDWHPNDDYGHGTHVAGTIAQTTNNDRGVAGLAHGASIMPVKVISEEGYGSYSDIADGIRFAADNGADVINLSVSGSQPSFTLEDAVRYAYEKGVTVVTSAGNSGQNDVSYPSKYDDYVISVGATRYDETLAPYSNHGPSLDLVAPGGDLDVDQDNDGYSDGVLQQTFYYSLWDFDYYYYQGTSMAAPHVAAAAAMIIAEDVANTPDEVREVLETTADDLGSAGKDNTYGNGLLNVEAALNYSTTPPVEDDEPVVSITSPSDSETVSGVVSITADASDDNGVDFVEFLVDGELLSTDTTSPYEYAWDSESVSNGAINISVVAHDTIGQTDTDVVSVQVDNVIETPSEIEVFSDSFENGFGQWTQDGYNDWFTSTQRSTDGNRSAEVDGYANGSMLTSVPIDLQGKSNATISFSWLIERGLDYNEYLAFAVSTDGGYSWVNTYNLWGDYDTENVWHDEVYEINDISSLQLRFLGKMNRGNEDANVDLVKVVAF